MILRDFNDVSSLLGEEIKKLAYMEKLRNRLYTSYYIRKKHGRREINTYLYKANRDELLKVMKLYDWEVDQLRRYSQQLEQLH